MKRPLHLKRGTSLQEQQQQLRSNTYITEKKLYDIKSNRMNDTNHRDHDL